jgi:hypothetical protein
MPVLETADDIAPRSVLRHRPVGNTASSTGRRLSAAPIMQRASRSRPVTPDTDEVGDEWLQGDEIDTRPGTQGSARRPSVTSKSLSHTPYPKTTVPRKTRQQAHPLLYLGVGMLVMLLLWTALSAVFGWFTTILDDIHYGRPRTYQTDAWVGHEQAGSPSHFIAINLNRHIEIIELPGGDAAHARIYVGPQLFGENDDLIPVTLRFVDVNGDHKPDMIANFQGSRVIFINENGAFRMAQPSERRQIEQTLQNVDSP